MYMFFNVPALINGLVRSQYMRGKGLLLILLVVLGISAYSQLASAGSKSVETAVVPKAPITVSCKVSAGHTVVSVSALDSVSDLAVDVGGHSAELADHLPRGWSVSRSVSGSYQSAVVRLTWRGAEQQIPVVCQ